MANQNQVKLDWSGIPPAVLNDRKNPIGKAWLALVDAREQAKALTEGPQAAFEKVVAGELAKSGKVPAGKEVAFAYNFGKAATALRDATTKGAKKEGGLW